MELKQAAQAVCDAWHNNKAPFTDYIVELQSAIGGDISKACYVEYKFCEHVDSTVAHPVKMIAEGANYFNVIRCMKCLYYMFVCEECNESLLQCPDCGEDLEE